MKWITDILSFFRPTGELQKEVNSQARELLQLKDAEVKELRARVAALESNQVDPITIESQERRIAQLERDERDCQQHMLQMQQQINELKNKK